MALRPVGTVAIPGANGSAFDHAAFDPRTRRVFIAHAHGVSGKCQAYFLELFARVKPVRDHDPTLLTGRR